MRLSRHAAERIAELPLSASGRLELARRLSTVAGRLGAGREYYVALGELPSVVGTSGEGRNGGHVFAVIAGGRVVTVFPRRASQGTRSRDVGKQKVTVNILADIT